MFSKFLSFTIYLLFRLLVGIFALIPFWLLYLISDAIRFLLQFVLRYRLEVVSSNLRRAFPGLSPAQIAKIRSAFYKSLSDWFLEGIKGFSMSEKSLKNRYRMESTDQLDKYFQEGRSVLFAGSHFNNWEWGVLIFNKLVPHQICGIYQVVSNPFIHEFLMRRRARFGMHLISARQAVSTITSLGGVNAIMTLSDQSPVNMEYAIWLDFLGTKTPFLHGLEAMAQKTHFPVVYYEVLREKRGYYRIKTKILVEHPEQTAREEITSLYADALEKTIRTQPAQWLWSHRRWKRA